MLNEYIIFIFVFTYNIAHVKNITVVRRNMEIFIEDFQKQQ